MSPKDRTKLYQFGLEGLKLKHLYSSEALNSLTTINNQFRDMARELSRSPMLEALRQMDEQNKRLRDQFLGSSLRQVMVSHQEAMTGLLKSAAPFAEQIAKMHSPLLAINETLQQQMRPIQDALTQFNQMNEHLFRGIADTIWSIPRESLLRIRLHAEHWLIVDANLLSEIVESRLDEETEVIPYVIGYYKEDGWKRFDLLVQTWRPQVSPERIEIFKTAIAVARESKEEVHLLTVPALIAQIDGLVRELYSALPKTVKKRVEQQIRSSLAPELNSKRVDLRKDVAVQTVAEMVDYWSAEVLQEAIFSGLFRDSKEIKPEESYSLFRHKIMHGDEDYLKHQNEENFVRLMLFSDFIVNLIKQIRDGSLLIEQNS